MNIKEGNVDTVLSILKNNNFLLRLLSSLVLFPAVIYLLFLNGIYSTLLIAIVASLALFEWAKLCGQSKFSHLKKMIWLSLGGLYIVSACYSFWSFTPVIQIFLIFIVSACDISAYITGRWLKGPKLAPRISPNKTWSGALGSIFFYLILFPFIFTLVQPDLTIDLGTNLGIKMRSQVSQFVFLWAGGLLIIIAQGGDLLQSWCKRKFGVKDSGSLIPGHGGVLDRIDSLLAVSLAGGLLTYLINYRG